MLNQLTTKSYGATLVQNRESCNENRKQIDILCVRSDKFLSCSLVKTYNFVSKVEVK